MENKTKVIFRKWKNGDVIAIFPEIVGTNSAATCMMFEHIGQHGAGDPQNVIDQTFPATPLEFEDVRKELEGAAYGYKLEVIKKHRYSHFLTRAKTLSSLSTI
jgi:hypothetical protein